MDVAELYREFGPAISAYFRQHRSTNVNAEDLLQETFLRALNHQERVARAASPQAYLFGIARHIRLDALRKRPMADDLIIQETCRAAEPEDPRLDGMRAAIQKLREPHRETLLLKLRHDLSYEEIAAVLQIPVGTVRSRLHYAVTELKRVLNPPTHTNDMDM